MTKFKAPRQITSHPGVARVLDGYDEGFDYKYDVELKPGWMFTTGRNAHCSNARFHNVAGFNYAHAVEIRPASVAAYQMDCRRFNQLAIQYRESGQISQALHAQRWAAHHHENMATMLHHLLRG